MSAKRKYSAIAQVRLNERDDYKVDAMFDKYHRVKLFQIIRESIPQGE
jgi:hypothetical protein